MVKLFEGDMHLSILHLVIRRTMSKLDDLSSLNWIFIEQAMDT